MKTCHALVLFLFTVLLVPGARAVDTAWTGGTGDWDTAANWSAGVPDVSKLVFIDNGGTVTLTSDSSAAGVSVGSLASGTLIIDGSTAWLHSPVSVGFNGGTGTLTVQNGGSLTSAGGVATIGNVNDAITGTGPAKVTVTGAGSSWSGTDQIFITRLNGTNPNELTVAAGGEISTRELSIGVADYPGVTSQTIINLNGTEGARGRITTELFGRVSGTAQVNFNGGILRAGANSTNFLTGLAGSGDVTVHSGGGFIDSNGFDIKIHALIGGTGALTKIGTGTLTLTNNSNSFDGMVLEQGTLIAGNDGALGTGPLTLKGGTTLGSAGTHTLAGAVHVDGDVTLGGGLSFSNSVYLNQDTVITVENADGSSSDVVFGGGFQNNHHLTLQAGAHGLGTGAVILNSYSNANLSTILSGKVVAGANFALGTGTIELKGGTLYVKKDVTNLYGTTGSLKISGGSYQREVDGSLTGKGDAKSDLGGTDTTAKILAGATTEERLLEIGFSTTSAAGNDAYRVSDVYHFEGTDTDLFALQLTIDLAPAGSILSWMNGSDLWAPAVTGNTGNNATAAMQNFNGTFFAFQSLYGTDLSAYVGAYGHWYPNGEVWAVVNHNSEFAVTTVAAVPEPSTWALLALGAGVMLFLRKRRNA